MPYKILVADPISDSGLQVFKEHADFQLDIRQKLSIDDLKKAVADVDAILVRSETKITSDILAAAKKVKIIGRAGVGVDNIDVQAASRQGVLVVNVPGGNTISAAEHTMALLLALSRNIPQANSSVKAGEWKRPQFTGSELQGKTLGLVGLGRIGREVAKRCLSFGMRIIGYDPYASEEYAKTFNIELVALEKLYKEADYISFHIPLTDATKHMINAKNIGSLKPGVRLINCARGGIIEEQALADAVQKGQIKGAALDVFEEEPPSKTNPLLAVPGIIVTPHLGAATEEAQVKVAQELAETIRDYFHQGSVRNAVNLPSIDAEQYRELEPSILLAEKLGRFVAQMTPTAVKDLQITYAGEISSKNTGPLTLAILKGFLAPMLDIEVNMVNAPYLAKERGLRWTEIKSTEASDYANLVSIKASMGKTHFIVEGSILSKKTPRIVSVEGLSVDVVPDGFLILYTNQDRPGVIGHIGSVLGQNKINIAAMQVGRKAIGGEAITIVNIDSPVPDAVLEQIRSYSGISNVRCVKL